MTTHYVSHPAPSPPLSHMQTNRGFQSDSLGKNVARLLWVPVQQGLGSIQNAHLRGDAGGALPEVGAGWLRPLTLKIGKARADDI